MRTLRTHSCAICSDEEVSPTSWFLVAENRWEDKLKILEWNDRLATQEGIHSACSAAHVQELVVHWMATGSLTYPFARTGPQDKYRVTWHTPVEDPDVREARPIGELSVHRESMMRVLNESPHSLKTILDALLSALQKNTVSEHEPECDVLQPVFQDA